MKSFYHFTKNFLNLINLLLSFKIEEKVFEHSIFLRHFINKEQNEQHKEHFNNNSLINNT